MNREKIEKEFNSYATAQKSAAITVRLILVFCFALVVIAFFFAFKFASSATSRILVVDGVTGKFLKVAPENSEKFFRTQMESHCATAVYYANSFDRLNIIENQARTVFMVNRADAARIFSRYEKQRAYADAIDRGLTYKTTFQKLDELSGNKEPYYVRFTSLLQVFDNDKPVREYYIHSEGEIRNHSPQWPENVAGLYFTKYTQEWEKKEVANE